MCLVIFLFSALSYCPLLLGKIKDNVYVPTNLFLQSCQLKKNFFYIGHNFFPQNRLCLYIVFTHKSLLKTGAFK